MKLTAVIGLEMSNAPNAPNAPNATSSRAVFNKLSMLCSR